MKEHLQKKIFLGSSDFTEVYSEDSLYVDKSLFIKHIVDDGALVKVILRPRRFGKSMNMRLLRNFFGFSKESEKNKLENIFKRLKIWSYQNLIEKHFMRYPVILINFSSVKGSSYDEAYQCLLGVISKLYAEHETVLFEGCLKNKKNTKAYYSRILEKKPSAQEEIIQSIKNLTEYLNEQYNTKTLVLIDEYDTPLVEGFNKEYYKEISDLISKLFGSALKDNDFLHSAVLTGILRVSKSNILSQLNNPFVYSILDDNRYGDDFGINEEELNEIKLGYSSLELPVGAIKENYGGYNINGRIVCNPWSVLNFIHNSGSEHIFHDYWVDSADKDIMRGGSAVGFLPKDAYSDDTQDLVVAGSEAIARLSDKKEKFLNVFLHDIKELLTSSGLTKQIDKDVSLVDAVAKEDALWSFLLLSGYLSFTKRVAAGEYTLRCPNRELTNFFEKQKEVLQEKVFEAESKSNFKLEEKLRRLKDSYVSTEEKCSIIELISSKGIVEGATVDAILRCFDSESSDLRKKVWYCLKQFKLIKKDYVLKYFLQQGLLSKMEEVRDHSLKILRKRRDNDSAINDVCKNNMGNHKLPFETRVFLFDTLNSTCPSDYLGKLKDTLLGFLCSDNSESRKLGFYGLSQIKIGGLVDLTPEILDSHIQNLKSNDRRRIEFSLEKFDEFYIEKIKNERFSDKHKEIVETCIEIIVNNNSHELREGSVDLLQILFKNIIAIRESLENYYVDCLNSAQEVFQEMAITSLGSLGLDKHIGKILAKFGSPVSNIKIASIKSYTKLCLVKKELNHYWDRLIELLADSDTNVQGVVVDAINELGLASEEAIIVFCIDKIKREFKALSKSHLQNLFKILCLAKESIVSDKIAPFLTENLNGTLDVSDEVKLESIESFKKLKLIKNFSVHKLLINMLGNKDFKFSATVISAFSDMPNDLASDELLDILKLSSSEDFTIKISILKLLMNLDANKVDAILNPAEIFLIQCLSNENHIVRKSAEEIIVKFKLHSKPSVLEYYINNLGNENSNIAKICIENIQKSTLRIFNRDRVYNALFSCLSKSDEAIRKLALDAIIILKLPEHYKQFLDSLRDCIDSTSANFYLRYSSVDYFLRYYNGDDYSFLEKTLCDVDLKIRATSADILQRQFLSSYERKDQAEKFLILMLKNLDSDDAQIREWTSDFLSGINYKYFSLSLRYLMFLLNDEDKNRRTLQKICSKFSVAVLKVVSDYESIKDKLINFLNKEVKNGVNIQDFENLLLKISKLAKAEQQAVTSIQPAVGAFSAMSKKHSVLSVISSDLIEHFKNEYAGLMELSRVNKLTIEKVQEIINLCARKMSQHFRTIFDYFCGDGDKNGGFEAAAEFIGLMTDCLDDFRRIKLDLQKRNIKMKANGNASDTKDSHDDSNQGAAVLASDDKDWEVDLLTEDEKTTFRELFAEYHFDKPIRLRCFCAESDDGASGFSGLTNKLQQWVDRIITASIPITIELINVLAPEYTKLSMPSDVFPVVFITPDMKKLSHKQAKHFQAQCFYWADRFKSDWPIISLVAGNVDLPLLDYLSPISNVHVCRYEPSLFRALFEFTASWLCQQYSDDGVIYLLKILFCYPALTALLIDERTSIKELVELSKERNILDHFINSSLLDNEKLHELLDEEVISLTEAVKVDSIKSLELMLSKGYSYDLAYAIRERDRTLTELVKLFEEDPVHIQCLSLDRDHLTELVLNEAPNVPDLMLDYALEFDVDFDEIIAELEESKRVQFQKLVREYFELPNDEEVINKSEKNLYQPKYVALDCESFISMVKKKGYVFDRTQMIRTFIETPRGEVAYKLQLITRPRRFGKTLNMTMLYEFLSDTINGQKNPNESIFRQFQICERPDIFTKHFAQYKVIHFTMKDINGTTPEGIFSGLLGEMSEQFIRFQGIEEELGKYEKPKFQRIAEKSLQPGNSNDCKELIGSLAFLAKKLKAAGHKVIILIDEYDKPFHNAHKSGNEKSHNMVLDFLSEALKSDFYDCGLLTGVSRVVKEGMFSGLNNCQVYSPAEDGRYSHYFGLTEDEVKEFVEWKRQTLSAERSKTTPFDFEVGLKKNYGGYYFGDKKERQERYMTYAVLKATHDFDLNKDYWTETGDTKVLTDAIEKYRKDYPNLSEKIRKELRVLIDNKAQYSLSVELSERLSYQDLYSSKSMFWAFLVSTGYVTVKGRHVDTFTLTVRLLAGFGEPKFSEHSEHGYYLYRLSKGGDVCALLLTRNKAAKIVEQKTVNVSKRLSNDDKVKMLNGINWPDENSSRCHCHECDPAFAKWLSEELRSQEYNNCEHEICVPNEELKGFFSREYSHWFEDDEIKSIKRSLEDLNTIDENVVLRILEDLKKGGQSLRQRCPDFEGAGLFEEVTDLYSALVKLLKHSSDNVREVVKSTLQALHCYLNDDVKRELIDLLKEIDLTKWVFAWKALREDFKLGKGNFDDSETYLIKSEDQDQVLKNIKVAIGSASSADFIKVILDDLKKVSYFSNVEFYQFVFEVLCKNCDNDSNINQLDIYLNAIFSFMNKESIFKSEILSRKSDFLNQLSRWLFIKNSLFDRLFFYFEVLLKIFSPKDILSCAGIPYSSNSKHWLSQGPTFLALPSEFLKHEATKLFVWSDIKALLKEPSLFFIDADKKVEDIMKLTEEFLKGGIEACSSEVMTELSDSLTIIYQSRQDLSLTLRKKALDIKVKYNLYTKDKDLVYCLDLMKVAMKDNTQLSVARGFINCSMKLIEQKEQKNAENILSKLIAGLTSMLCQESNMIRHELHRGIRDDLTLVFTRRDVLPAESCKKSITNVIEYYLKMVASENLDITKGALEALLDWAVLVKRVYFETGKETASKANFIEIVTKLLENAELIANSSIFNTIVRLVTSIKVANEDNVKKLLTPLIHTMSEDSLEEFAEQVSKISDEERKQIEESAIKAVIGSYGYKVERYDDIESILNSIFSSQIDPIGINTMLLIIELVGKIEVKQFKKTSIGSSILAALEKILEFLWENNRENHERYGVLFSRFLNPLKSCSELLQTVGFNKKILSHIRNTDTLRSKYYALSVVKHFLVLTKEIIEAIVEIVPKQRQTLPQDSPELLAVSIILENQNQFSKYVDEGFLKRCQWFKQNSDSTTIEIQVPESLMIQKPRSGELMFTLRHPMKDDDPVEIEKTVKKLKESLYPIIVPISDEDAWIYSYAYYDKIINKGGNTIDFFVDKILEEVLRVAPNVNLDYYRLSLTQTCQFLQRVENQNSYVALDEAARLGSVKDLPEKYINDVITLLNSTDIEDIRWNLIKTIKNKNLSKFRIIVNDQILNVPLQSTPWKDLVVSINFHDQKDIDFVADMFLQKLMLSHDIIYFDHGNKKIIIRLPKMEEIFLGDDFELFFHSIVRAKLRFNFFRMLNEQLVPLFSNSTAVLSNEKSAVQEIGDLIMERRKIPTLWNLPPENHNFTGRMKLLEEIRMVLSKQAKEVKEIKETKESSTHLPIVVTVLCGLGGVGKTQLVTQYAYQNCHRYNRVFWIRADSSESLQADYFALAKELGLQDERPEDTLKRVKHWLESNPLNLLIYDDVPDFDVIRTYLPERGCHVLMTSRFTKWPRESVNIKLDCFTKEECRDYIQGILGDGGRLNTLEDIDDLASTLGRLPLALAQACGYLTQVDEISIQEYLKRYREANTSDKIKLLSNTTLPAGNKDDHASVSVTFELSRQDIEKKSPLAGKLLNVCAFLHLQNIPYFLLKEIGSQKDFNPIQNNVSEALTLLSNFSLINRDLKSQTCNIHVLVQEMIQLNLDEAETARYVNWIYSALVKLYPYKDNQDWQNKLEHLAIKRVLLPHLESLLPRIEKDENKLMVVLERMQDGCYYLGDARKQKELLERALVINEKHYGLDHPEVARTLVNLGDAYRVLGNAQKGKEFLERALAIEKKHYGSNHPEVAITLGNLGIAYSALGNAQKGKELLEDALLILEKDSLGKDYDLDKFELARTLENLGILEGVLGKAERGKALLVRALAIFERNYGKKDYSIYTCVTLIALGNIVDSLGDTDEGRTLIERGVLLEKTSHENHGHKVEFIQTSLGWLYSVLGTEDKRKALLERCLPVYQKCYGVEHEYTREITKKLKSTVMEEVKEIKQKKEGNYSASFSNFNDTLAKTNSFKEVVKNDVSVTSGVYEKLSRVIQEGWFEDDMEKAIAASLQESEALQALKVILLSEATSFGFMIREMKRDGNCFFHGASDQLQEIGYPNSKIFTPEYLRQCVVQHLIDYLDLYKNSVEEEIDEFIVKMSRAGEWADFVILHALARVLKVNIVLIRSDAQDPTVFRRKNPLGTLYLGYEVGLHFQSLVIDKKIKPEKNINAFIERAEIDNFEGVIKLPEVLPPQPEKQVYSENVKYTNNANNTNSVSNANNLNRMGIFASHESVQSASKISSFLEIQSKFSGSVPSFGKTNARNSATTKFNGTLDGSNELNFECWLSRDSVSVLLPLIVQKGNANVMTFCALDGGQGIAAYSSQIKKALQEARKEEKSLFVISKEPSGFASQHYVLTIFHKERIYFIDPTGQVRNGFCKEFNALFAPFDMKKVPLLTSKTKLQNDPEKSGLVSCGVICLALCEFFAEEENLIKLENIQDKLETQKSLNEDNTYFMYNEFELSKLSPTLKSPHAESYREIMVSYRAKFYSMLNELDEEHIENLREADHALLELIQEADISQDEVNRIGFGLN